MATHWTYEKTFAYRLFTKRYISGYAGEIDCADLALVSLVEYAYENALPLKLKYYDHGWKTYDSASHPDKEEFKRLVTRNMGALNVIDNSHAIPITEASAGDLIMSRWDSRLGHTRISARSPRSPARAAPPITTWSGSRATSPRWSPSGATRCSRRSSTCTERSPGGGTSTRSTSEPRGTPPPPRIRGLSR